MVVAETVTGPPAAAVSARSASARRGSEPRVVTDDLDGDVADGVPGLRHAAGCLLEQDDAGGARPLWIGRAELASEVAEAGGRQQRVAGRVGRDVAVGVADEPRSSSGQARPARCIGTPAARRCTSTPTPTRGIPVYVGRSPSPGRKES